MKANPKEYFTKKFYGLSFNCSTSEFIQVKDDIENVIKAAGISAECITCFFDEDGALEEMFIAGTDARNQIIKFYDLKKTHDDSDISLIRK